MRPRAPGITASIDVTSSIRLADPDGDGLALFCSRPPAISSAVLWAYNADANDEVVRHHGVTVRNETFVGREEQLRELLALWHAAAGGSGRLAVVSGDAGIGKTLLVENLAGVIAAEGRVGWGSCAGPVSPPLWPWRAVLRDLGRDATAADHGASSDLADPASDQVRRLGRLVDELPRRPAVARVPRSRSAGMSHLRVGCSSSVPLLDRASLAPAATSGSTFYDEAISVVRVEAFVTGACWSRATINCPATQRDGVLGIR